MTNDREYFARRAEQERDRAATAERPDVRRAHLELAALYTDRLGPSERPLLHVIS